MSASAKTAPSGYSGTQITLHWIVFLVIVAQYVLHEAMVDAWRAILRGEESSFDPVVASHVFGGIILLALVLWRIVLRVKRGAPKPPEHEPAILKLAAGAIHLGLYALLILMPLSGMAAWFGNFEAAAEAHEVMRLLLLALIVIHIAGALYQRFILKTDVMAHICSLQILATSRMS